MRRVVKILMKTGRIEVCGKGLKLKEPKPLSKQEMENPVLA